LTKKYYRAAKNRNKQKAAELIQKSDDRKTSLTNSSTFGSLPEQVKTRIQTQLGQLSDLTPKQAVKELRTDLQASQQIHATHSAATMISRRRTRRT
jgi:hypothetical protein